MTVPNGLNANSPTIIIVSGSSTTGKTAVASHLAAMLAMPLVSRDDFCESMHAHFATSQQDWPEGITAASYAILYDMIERLLKAGISHIIESDFDTELDSSCFIDLQRALPYQAVQVICTSPQEDMQPLTIESEVIRLNTDDLTPTDYHSIVACLKRQLTTQY